MLGGMSATLYLIAWAGTLLDQLAGIRLAGTVAGAAILLFLALEYRRQKPMLQGVLALLLAGGLAAVLAAPDPWAAWLASWRRGAAYAAFFLALGALRFAAQHSAIILRCGQHLLGQQARRRYLALTLGGHLFSIILSYGAIDLLGAMLRQATGRARGRMMLAAYRGFATMNCWSPLNIMTAVVSAAVPAVVARSSVYEVLAPAARDSRVLADTGSTTRQGVAGARPSASRRSAMAPAASRAM